MLFGYPIEATAENWLHECLVAILDRIHLQADRGEDPLEWPGVVPVQYRPRLEARTGLRDRVANYDTTYRGLTEAERRRVRQCLVEQNRISELCACVAHCETLPTLHQSIRAPTKELFQFSFTLIRELGVRDQQYAAIYKGLDYKVCPFCGCEYFDAPGAPREDLDHYLAKSSYPFAAANLRNLVPMGTRCNQRYKGAEDILVDAQGRRRRAFDPYTERKLEVSLIGSIPYADGRKVDPDWQISFAPDSPECETWDQVFSVRERIVRDVLDPSFPRWLGDFRQWFECRAGGATVDSVTILDHLREYAELLDSFGLSARDFLRAPVFRMIHQQCSSGNQKLTDFVVTLLRTSP